MCEFQKGTYECRGDGYVWDADNDWIDYEDISWPCPNCNTKQYLLNAKEEAESTAYYRAIMSAGSGVTIWQGAVTAAKYWNSVAASIALVEIGRVVAIYEDKNEEEGFGEEIFEYV